jgi:hypothetical protein
MSLFERTIADAAIYAIEQAADYAADQAEDRYQRGLSPL